VGLPGRFRERRLLERIRFGTNSIDGTTTRT
jgi:hypothetical protein